MPAFRGMAVQQTATLFIVIQCINTRYSPYLDDPIKFQAKFTEFKMYNNKWLLYSVHPEIGKFGRDQGARKILPQAYG